MGRRESGRMARVVRCLLLALVALTQGCMWSRSRMNDPEIVTRAQQIQPGVTKVSELPVILNAQPTRKTRAGKTVVYEYSYSDVKSKSFMLVVVNFSRTENVTETLYVETDAETGVVTRLPPLKSHEPEWRWWPFGDD